MALHHVYLIVLGVMSVLTVAFYAFDKSAARGRRWRVRESTLHVLELLGGWPGGILSREFLRHKSRKRSFRLISWLIVLLHLALVGWWTWGRGNP
jgi:uncharacterized membrane protein YsdA (DUF1294 family)